MLVIIIIMKQGLKKLYNIDIKNIINEIYLKIKKNEVFYRKI